jgi:predicted lipid-binding transport protein (Tim44 family)
MASVRFTGTLKENNEQTQLNEIWHFRQLDKGQDWLVGGIQQEVYKP